jgi:membrane protease YdiL (CAAX protease family)
LKLVFIKKIAFYPAPARLTLFIVTLLVLWLPVAAPLYWLLRNDPNLVSIVTMVILYLIFLVLVQLWGKLVYNHPNLLKRYGLVNTSQNWLNLLRGFSLGLAVCLGIFLLQGLLGWLNWQSGKDNLAQIALEAILIGLGIGLAEELFFRGWLLDELERDYTPVKAMWLNGVIFGLLHFLKPLAEIIRTLPQLPGLIALSFILVDSKRLQQQRLGMSIGIHGGLVSGYYLINVGKLITYTQVVPDWVTGIDGNPLAGLMGWCGLTILAWLVRKAGVRG